MTEYLYAVSMYGCNPNEHIEKYNVIKETPKTYVVTGTKNLVINNPDEKITIRKADMHHFSYKFFVTENDAKKYIKMREKEIKRPDIDLEDDDFGAILNCAVRYALGRQSYMPKLVIDYITPLLPYLNDKTLWCMEKDIREAENMGYGYGDPKIDKPGWIQFLLEIQKEIRERKEDNT